MKLKNGCILFEYSNRNTWQLSFTQFKWLTGSSEESQHSPVWSLDCRLCFQWNINEVCRSAPHSPLPAQVLPLAALSVWLSVVSRLNYLPSASIFAYHQTLGLSPCNYLGSVSPWGRISGPGRERMWDKVWLWLGGRHRRPQADPLPLTHRKHLQYHSRRLSGQVEESIFLECSKRSGMQVRFVPNYRTQLKWLADRYLDVEIYVHLHHIWVFEGDTRVLISLSVYSDVSSFIGMTQPQLCHATRLVCKLVCYYIVLLYCVITRIFLQNNCL